MDFTLLNYLDEIEAIMDKSGCTPTAAVDRFIFNLDTFREYKEGTHTLNYHVLGQYWGNLPCSDKLAQKKEAKQRMLDKFNNPRRTGTRRTTSRRT